MLHSSSPTRSCSITASLLVTGALLAALGHAAAADPSKLGQQVIEAVASASRGQRGLTWNYSNDNRDFSVVQTPPADTWGKPYAALKRPALCERRTARNEDDATVYDEHLECDADFELQLCGASHPGAARLASQRFVTGNRDGTCPQNSACVSVQATVRAPGEVPRTMCVGHSDADRIDGLYQLIVSAKTVVDITTLTAPDGRFVPAIRNAIAFLGKTRPASAKPVVRLLTGWSFWFTGVTVDVGELLAQLTEGLAPNAAVVVEVGAYQAAADSWNHSKIVAVDGERALVGGHNMVSADYLDERPVRDLSILVSGTAALDAQRFAALIWQRIRVRCESKSWIMKLVNEYVKSGLTQGYETRTWENGKAANVCAREPGLAMPPLNGGAGGYTVISVGRVGWLEKGNRNNPADIAQVALLNAAQRSIRISQQDLLPVKARVVGNLTPWPDDFLDAIAAAIARGVAVEIVISGERSNVGKDGNANYSYGWSIKDVIGAVAERLAEGPLLPPAPQPYGALLCANLKVSSIKYSADEVTYPDGSRPGNHAKLIMVDDQAFYVGSQNLYPNANAEFGYIVDDARKAEELLKAYWTPMWNAAGPTAERPTGDVCQRKLPAGIGG
jgi:phosphatidylserine/phosphatidylglycerophosphate/cardiolipin synthase-like enzyme